MKKNIKKKILMCLVATALVASSTACQSTTSKEPTTAKSSVSSTVAEEKKNTSGTVEQTKLSESASQAIEEELSKLSESDLKKLDMLKKYFDVNKYLLNPGGIADNTITQDISSIEVDGIKFELGMSYNDVIATGYAPKDSSSVDSSAGKSIEFTNSTGNSIELIFKVDNNSKKTITEEGFLYGIKVDTANRKIVFNNFNENSTITDIIETLGTPYNIGLEDSNVGMLYSKAGVSFQKVTFYNDLETEKMNSIEVSGYVETSSDEELSSSKERSDNSADTEEKEMQMLKKYLDVDTYRLNKGYITDNTTSKDISSIEVNGDKFELGMSYEDVVAMGYKPSKSSFADEKLGEGGKSDYFTNNSGSSVNLYFEAESNSDITVAEADSFGIRVEPENQKFIFNGIGEDSTISDIIKTFGNPYYIKRGHYSEKLDAYIVYKNQKESSYVEFDVDLETEKIIHVAIYKL